MSLLGQSSLFFGGQFVGRPAFGLSEDQVATVVDLINQGANLARPKVQQGMDEPKMSRIVRKEMRRCKNERGLTNLEIRGEDEIDDMDSDGYGILGRIDITFKFSHQFGYEEAYVAVECKRVGNPELNRRYVTEGVSRFATEDKYAIGHEWAFMLGYMRSMPVEDIVDAINRHLRKRIVNATELEIDTTCSKAINTYMNTVNRGTKGEIVIKIKHIFVKMDPIF